MVSSKESHVQDNDKSITEPNFNHIKPMIKPMITIIIRNTNLQNRICIWYK